MIYLWRRQVAGIQTFEGLDEQLVSQDRSQALSHDSLLLNGAVVLQGQDQRIGRCLSENDKGVALGLCKDQRWVTLQCTNSVDVDQELFRLKNALILQTKKGA